MRSPWLSREYKKEKNLIIEKNNNTYIIKNTNLNTSIEIDETEFEKFNNEKLNEIEWEKYFFRGLAIDKNGDELIFDNELNYNMKFKKNENVKHFPLKVDNQTYFIIINPDLGSWMALTKIEFEKYKNNSLNNFEWESLFVRGLASNENVEYDLLVPEPAEYPSVVVVNITTDCNLRCKYCFANCGEIKAEYMEEPVMKKVIENMLLMPVKMITFEFQGGEASIYVEGIKKFIKISEEMKKGKDIIVKYRTEINCVDVSDELCELFKKYDVSTGISLDGPKELNDQYRVDIKGNGSYDRIMLGLKKLRKYGVPIDGSVCTIGKNNVHYPKEIMYFFDKIGISFKPRPINILGREIKNNLAPEKGEWYECYKEMHKIKDDVKIDNFSIHIFEENVYTPVRDYICLRYPCGAAREIISVNPNGDVFPCDGFKSEKEFVMGNLMSESLYEMLKKEKIIKLKSRTAKDIEKCSKCLFRGMCCSCCYSAKGKYGSIYREDPHCYDKQQIYKFLIEDWLRKNA